MEMELSVAVLDVLLPVADAEDLGTNARQLEDLPSALDTQPIVSTECA